MAEESDGIEEAFEGQLRMLVTAAARAGEEIARLREQARRRAQAASEQEARELASRLAAEQQAARAETAGVHHSEWWDRATPEQIAHTFQVAHAWSREDSEAARAESRMREELRVRFGVDVANVRADPAALREAVERAAHDRAQSDAERARAAAEEAEAERVMQQSDRDDARAEQAQAAAEHEPDPAERERAATETEQRARAAAVAREDGKDLYDSAERRRATASDLAARGIDHDVVATRVRADVSQAKPATEAVTTDARGRAPKARKFGLRKQQAEVSR
ncbi:hypothetical protein [Sanguibacter massiliensis]|uniref:hypothetical protein n=1 Tax=Sanguibacter massiliensis TaxID=1973217 RepID=UPI000C838D06|nr:hypothetical protein [Sanguibacter massiliensis]